MKICDVLGAWEAGVSATIPSDGGDVEKFSSKR